MTAPAGARLSLVAMFFAAAATLSCSQARTDFSGLPWIENDYAAALALAQEKDLPIFVESWAPW